MHTQPDRQEVAEFLVSAPREVYAIGVEPGLASHWALLPTPPAYGQVTTHGHEPGAGRQTVEETALEVKSGRRFPLRAPCFTAEAGQRPQYQRLGKRGDQLLGGLRQRLQELLVPGGLSGAAAVEVIAR